MSMLHKHARDSQLASHSLSEIARAWDDVVFCAGVIEHPTPDHKIDREQKIAQLLEAIKRMRVVASAA